MLTYELDCFIFRDDLDYWCAKDYDYIGAPWFEGWSNPQPGAKLLAVGNSGFSLRKIASTRAILKSIFYKKASEHSTSTLANVKVYLRYPYRWIRNQFGENYTLQYCLGLHEDSFFSRIAPTYYPSFKVATVEDGLRFSFEVKPEILYEMNNQQLPTGCHAWWRYNLEFWKPHIKAFHYDL